MIDQIAIQLTFILNNKKLNQKQVSFLLNQIDNNGKSGKELARTYNISPSTLYNIKNNREHYMRGSSRRKFVEIEQVDEIVIKNFLFEFIKTWRKPFTISDLCFNLNLKTGIDVPYHKIREIIENKFYMSYKRTNSRPKCYANRATFAARCLFSINFASILNENNLIVNIDEWYIGRSRKSNYSWEPKGSNIECQNINVVGNICLILAICSNGCWFMFTTQDNINSN